MKKKFSLLLAILMLVILTATAFASQNWTKAVKNYNRIIVDGYDVPLNAYIVDNYTYIKLRDIAAIVNGKKCQFNVGYDNSLKLITITSNVSYNIVDGDLIDTGTNNAKALMYNRNILVDGELKVIRTALINRFNYVQLRDISSLVGLGVDYDAFNKTIVLNTDTTYTYTDNSKSSDIFNFNNNTNNIDNNTNDLNQIFENETKKLEFSDEKSRREYVDGFNNGIYFDHDKFINEFERLLNEERDRNGLSALRKNSDLQTCTEIRAREQAELGDQRSDNRAHIRPDGSRWNTAFIGDFFVSGECTAIIYGPALNDDVKNYTVRVYKGDSATIKNEEDLANVFFTTWYNSPGHYKIMMNPNADYFAVSAKMSQMDAPQNSNQGYNPIICVFNVGKDKNNYWR